MPRATSNKSKKPRPNQGAAPANIDADAPDPNYVDDGQPVTIRLSLDQTGTWLEQSHMADAFRANFHVHAQRISEIAANDVLIYGHGGVLLYHHRRNASESGET